MILRLSTVIMTNRFVDEMTATFAHFRGLVLELGTMFVISALVMSRHPVCPLRKLDNLVAASVGVTEALYSVAHMIRRTGFAAQLSKAAVLPEVIVALAFDIASAAPVAQPVEEVADADGVDAGEDVALLVGELELVAVLDPICPDPGLGLRRKKPVRTNATTTIPPRIQKSIRRFFFLPSFEPVSFCSLIMLRVELITTNS